MHRRDFLKNATAVAGAAATSQMLKAESTTGMIYRPLGRTGADNNNVVAIVHLHVLLQFLEDGWFLVDTNTLPDEFTIFK